MNDPTELRFFAYGLPSPQGNHRVSKTGVIYETSKSHKPWRQDVITAARDAWTGEPFDGPLELTVTFWLPRPKSAKKAAHWQWKMPDLSKLVRATEDALKIAGTIVDDARFCNILAAKRLVPVGGGPTGAEITIARLEDG